MRLKKEYANTFQDGEVKSKGYFYEKVYGPNGKITKWYDSYAVTAFCVINLWITPSSNYFRLSILDFCKYEFTSVFFKTVPA